jgi:DnaJ-class molecular chaperone
VSSINASVRCPTCKGSGLGEPTRGRRYLSGYYDWHETACRDCDGSGRRYCDVHYQSSHNPRPAIIEVMTPDMSSPLRLCAECHADEMAEQARQRAEDRLTKQLEESR